MHTLSFRRLESRSAIRRFADQLGLPAAQPCFPPARHLQLSNSAASLPLVLSRETNCLPFAASTTPPPPRTPHSTSESLRHLAQHAFCFALRSALCVSFASTALLTPGQVSTCARQSASTLSRQFSSSPPRRWAIRVSTKILLGADRRLLRLGRLYLSLPAAPPYVHLTLATCRVARPRQAPFVSAVQPACSRRYSPQNSPRTPTQLVGGSPASQSLNLLPRAKKKSRSVPELTCRPPTSRNTPTACGCRRPTGHLSTNRRVPENFPPPSG